MHFLTLSDADLINSVRQKTQQLMDETMQLKCKLQNMEVTNEQSNELALRSQADSILLGQRITGLEEREKTVKAGLFEYLLK